MPEPDLTRAVPRVCLVGTAPPRRCGIATFTDDLRVALESLHPPTPAVQIAMTNGGERYDYGSDVVFEVQASQLSDYRAAAEFVDQSDVDVVCVQHEFGIFGGPSGRYICSFLDGVSASVVTTLHTVLAEPSRELRDTLRAVAHRSDRLVVLADSAVGLLQDVYGIAPDKVRVIPHGVPDVAYSDPSEGDAKAAIGAAGRTVLMTFGLLGPDKGIDVVIDALPAVVAAHPEVLYVVLGATHPEIKRYQGEAHRRSLEAQVARLGLQDHVVFHDRYVGLDELCSFLRATDVYLTPYRGAEQIVSGTLAYAAGMGRAIVSTPYRYARELLADGRGRLVPFGDAAALGDTLVDVLDHPDEMARMRRRCYDFARSMTWPAVAQAYTDLFAEVVVQHERPAVAYTPAPLPPANFAYLRALTDDTGLLQHAPHGVPDRAHGYCTDDVGRALVVAIQGVARADDAVAASLVPTYLSFLRAAQRPDGSFDNLLGYDRRFVAGTASGDTVGQAAWGLGAVVSDASDEGWRSLAASLLERALPAIEQLHETKPMAYAISGLHGYLQRFPGALAVRRTLQRLATHLVERLAVTRAPGWEWFDAELTYGNARVPHALVLAGRACENDAWVAAGLSTLDFLLEATYSPGWATAAPGELGHFEFVGNDGWFPRNGHRTVYGQQPIEAGYTADACMAAYELTGEARYLERAEAAVQWLVGRNRLGLALYDPATGRCVDGLDRHGVSGNAGAESAVCALLAVLAVPSAAGVVDLSDAMPSVADEPDATDTAATAD